MGRAADIYVVLVTPGGQLLTIGLTPCPCLVETPLCSESALATNLLVPGDIPSMVACVQSAN